MLVVAGLRMRAEGAAHVAQIAHPRAEAPRHAEAVAGVARSAVRDRGELLWREGLEQLRRAAESSRREHDAPPSARVEVAVGPRRGDAGDALAVDEQPPRRGRDVELAPRVAEATEQLVEHVGDVELVAARTRHPGARRERSLGGTRADEEVPGVALLPHEHGEQVRIRLALGDGIQVGEIGRIVVPHAVAPLARRAREGEPAAAHRGAAARPGELREDDDRRPGLRDGDGRRESGETGAHHDDIGAHGGLRHQSPAATAAARKAARSIVSSVSAAKWAASTRASVREASTADTIGSAPWTTSTKCRSWRV